MTISESDLIKYRISSYKTKTLLIQYGKPKIINDEGSLFRINELQVISKFEIENISLGDD